MKFEEESSMSPPAATGDAWEQPESRRRRVLRLRSRGAAAFGVLALAVSALLAAVSYGLTRDYLLDQRRSAATRQAYANAQALRVALRVSDPDLPSILEDLRVGSSSYVVAQIGGRSFSTAIGVSPTDLPMPLTRAVEEGFAGHHFAELDGTPILAVGVPIEAAGAAYFELVDLEELEDTLATLARALTIGAVVAALVGSLIGLYASRRILRPLRAVAATASGITEGNLQARLDASGDRDLGPLVDAFNHMVDALQQRIDRESRFASDASHELRAPLAAMESAISVARRRVEDPEAVSQVLDVLAEKTASFQGLANDLLEISRLEAGVARLDVEEIDPESLARNAVGAAGMGHVPVRAEPGTPQRVRLDRRRVGQVLVNFLENAERYAGGATGLVVSGGDGVVRFAVEDEGPGVPLHERRYVFERFARGEAAARAAAQSGTGLGLALAAEHARLHRGRVWVEDRESGGARFVIELPERAR